MVTHHKLSLFMVFFLMFGTFYGCGGGGGDNSNESSSNIAPVADAGTDQTVRPSSNVNLNGSSSTDADGTIVSYQWQQPPGTTINLVNADTANAQFTTPTTNGELVFQLTVTDDDGAQDSDFVTITVSDTANLTPVANAGLDQTVPQGSIVTLDGTSSADDDGTIVSYNWEQTQGTTVVFSDANSANTQFTAPSTDEELIFRLTVRDDDEAESSDLVSIIVSGTINVPPVAEAGAAQTVLENVEVNLDGSSSMDEDGEIVSYQWTQIQGTPVTLVNANTVNAQFSAPGTTEEMVFQLTVQDDGGAQHTDTVSVYVSEILFSDSFANTTSLDDWDEPIDSIGGASWTVSDGVLLQQTNAVTSLTESYHLGAYQLLNAVSSLDDYRFSVIITPAIDSEGNDVGIMFRRLDANNYYRVSMNNRFGFSRFEKRINGNFHTLAVNAIGYVKGQDMNLTVETNGSTIIVWIDGDPVFAVVDSDIASGTVALYCQDKASFDNVQITESTLQPTVVISSPLAYSVALTRDDGDTLSAEAMVLNAPSGSSVVFTLDGSSEITGTASGNVHSATFTGVADGEHDIMASLLDSDGNEVGNDINSTVGTGGDYYVTVGDSITNGTGDDDSTNNDSADGRIVAIQGYQAPLADALTNTTQSAQIVYNEGIGGDTAANLNGRIDSILNRHPRANKVLMMIGTNDAGNRVSANNYEAAVLDIIGKISDKSVWLAKPMPTYYNDGTWTLNDDRNGFIELYNSRIDQIVAATPDVNSGPNFYESFVSTDYYADYLHPDDSGYQLMAEEWHDVLTTP